MNVPRAVSDLRWAESMMTQSCVSSPFLSRKSVKTIDSPPQVALRGMLLPILLLCIAAQLRSSVAEHSNESSGKEFASQHGCFNNSAILDRTRQFLEEAALQRAKPHIPALQELNSQINGELAYHIEHLKWKVIQRLMKENPKFTIRSSVEFHFADVAQVVRKFIFLQSDIEDFQMKQAIQRSLRDFLINVFPSAFLCLCLPMGSCKSASAAYIQCLARNAHMWQKSFFDADLDGIAHKITVIVARYRRVQRTADEVFAVLLQASENLDEECFEEFAEARFCETTVFCPDLCIDRAKKCYQSIGIEWAKKLVELQTAARNFGSGFAEIEQDVLKMFLSSQTLKSTTAAELAFKKCGPLRQIREEGANEAYISQNREKPKSFEKGTVHMVEKLIAASFDLWSRPSADICPLELAPKQKCFNGTDFIIPSAHIIETQGQLKKDVGEAPSEHRKLTSVISTSAERGNFEGSGAFDWSDDEDLAIEGSGSGSPPIIEDVTPSEPPPRIEIVPDVRVREDPATSTESPRVIEIQATTPRSSNAVSYTIVPVLAAFYALRIVLA